MKCETCKEREATLHIQEISGGRVVDVHLCEECAGKRGVLESFEPGLLPLRGLVSSFSGDRTLRKKKARKVSCPGCGLTWERFRGVGKLGCAECWPAFRSEMARLLRRIHGTSLHAGKIPARLDADIRKKSEISRLQQQLRQAVNREEYERAAELRTQICDLESRPEGADA